MNDTGAVFGKTETETNFKTTLCWALIFLNQT